MKERLTERADGTIYYKDTYDTIIDRLAKYEDLEEQGLIVRLPCKVGDCAWFVKAMGQYSTIISTNVSKIKITGTNEYVIHLLNTNRRIYLDKSGRNDNAFLTLAEAEKKLEELKEKDNGISNL